MAAGEDQPQPVVREPDSPASPGPASVVLDEQRQRPAQRRLAAGAGRGRGAARRGQPGAGLRRDAALRPGREGRGVRVLDALLGEVEVAGDAHRRGEHEGPLATVRVGHRRGDAGSRRHRSALSRRPSPAAPRRRRTAPGTCLASAMRLVEVGGLDQVVAAEGLLGLRERPVGDANRRAVLADRGGGGGRLQRVAAAQLRARRRFSRSRLCAFMTCSMTAGRAVAQQPRPRRSESGTAPWVSSCSRIRWSDLDVPPDERPGPGSTAGKNFLPPVAAAGATGGSRAGDQSCWSKTANASSTLTAAGA